VELELENSVAGFLGVHIERDELDGTGTIKLSQKGLTKCIVEARHISDTTSSVTILETIITTTGKVKNPYPCARVNRKILTELPSEIKRSTKTSTTEHLFYVIKDARKLPEAATQHYHHLVANLLYLSR